MAYLNKVSLIGNLGQDPESKTTPSGVAMTNASLATTRKPRGQKEKKTEWHSLVFFNRGNYKLADIAAEYLKKGAQIFVEGELSTQQWEKDGHKFQKTRIIVNELQMLGSLASGINTNPAPAPANSPAVNIQPAIREPGGKFDDFDDDIPF